MLPFYRRQFLNRPHHHSVGFVLAEVDGNYPTLIIGDCSRQVSLDVCLSERDADADEVDNTLHKLDVLVKTLRDFRKACYEQAGITPPRL